MKKWVINNLGAYELHFCPFYDDEILLSFCVDKNDKTLYWFVSDLLKIEEDCQHFDSIDEAKEEFENLIAEYFGDQIIYYEGILNKFQNNTKG